MTDTRKWVPMHWRREWRDPSLLDLLKGTPVNCLVIPADAAQDSALAPVLERARNQGLTMVGSSDRKPTAVPGLAAVVQITPRHELDWNTSSPILAVGGTTWPGINVASDGGGSGAGPTGVPWVDANGWIIDLVKTRASDKTIWFAYNPPSKLVLRPESYALAVTDSEAYGARWIIAFEQSLDFAGRSTQAMAAWKRITDTLAFFEARRAWSDLPSLAAVGVISDFAGPNEDFAGEILNLLPRRPLPYHTINRSQAVQASFTGLRAIIYADEQTPAEPLRQKLLAFADGGGLVLTVSDFGTVKGTPAPPDPHGRYNIFNVGKGRVAIAREPGQDPYNVAVDTHLILSHRRDVLRLWNGGSLNPRIIGQPDGKRAVVQLINYSTRTAEHPVTLGLEKKYKTARMIDLEKASAPIPLQINPAVYGIELPLPQFPVFAAIELES